MPDLHEALELVTLLEEVADRIKDNELSRSYMSPDERAYVLALGGDDAKDMHDFMYAVGKYLTKAKLGTPAEKATARAEMLRDFELWLSKQKLP